MDFSELPVPAIDKIIEHIRHRWHLACTCKTFYERICEAEKFKHVAKIYCAKKSEGTISLIIDDDCIYESVINTLRKINEVDIYVEPREFSSNIRAALSQRQVERIIAVLTKFSATVTALGWNLLTLSVGNAIRMLQCVPNLKSLSIRASTLTGQSNIRMNNLVPQLTTIKIMEVTGFFHISRLLNRESLTGCVIFSEETDFADVARFLLGQTTITALHVWYPVDSHTTRRMQLRELGLHRRRYNNNQLSKVLQFQSKLKKLSFEGLISGNSFKWICENLPNLEALEAGVKDSEDLVHLTNLTKLTWFKTTLKNVAHLYAVQCSTLKTLIIDEDEDLQYITCLANANFGTVARNFPSIIDIRTMVSSINQMYVVMHSFRRLIKFSGWIENPVGRRNATNVYPNITHLTVINEMTAGEMNFLVDAAIALPNLEYLSCAIVMHFDVAMMETFVEKCVNLKYFEMRDLDLGGRFAVNEVFREVLRRIDNRLSSYIIVFRTMQKLPYLKILKQIMFKDFNVRVKEAKSEFSPSTLTIWRGSASMFKTHDD